MIRLSVILHSTGALLLLLAAAMLVPLAYAMVIGDRSHQAFALAWGITAGAGGACFRLFRPPDTDLKLREGLLVVSLTWFAVSLFGALPFYLSPSFASFTDAVFETVSGFTTTGASILSDVESLPRSLQLWRCFTHWVGGLGIVVLGVAVLPLLSGGGLHLYRAEFSGARSEKLKPRVTETALALWRIYAVMTLVEVLALRLAGLGTSDAVCHAFSTMGTGGFSTKTASIAAFHNPIAEYIVIIFMILAGMNFARHYQLWVEGRVRDFFRDPEIRAYLVILGMATIVVALSLWLESGYSLEEGWRAALFQTTSILTTTGFVTDDYERWKPVCQLSLLLLMFIGGCTGSTAGGLKVARLLLLAKVLSRQFRRIVEPRAVLSVRLGREVIPEPTIQSLLSLVNLALVVFAVASLILAATGLDLLSAIAAVAACMFNIGPGLGTVGPSDNYAHLPVLAKWVLAFCMICGRLEFVTSLVIFAPGFWRK